MDASINFTEEIEMLLQCNICLQRLDDPKELTCSHSFCKSCLDSILIFSSDGNAVINCPLRCNEGTTIDVDKTTNDLKAPKQYDEIAGFLNTENDGDVTKSDTECYEYPNCKNILSFSCSLCFVKLCSSCKTSHKHDKTGNPENIQFIPIRYKRDIDELLPWCDEHATYATYACQEGFICLYCKARDHSNHHYDTIETLSQQIVAWVQNQKVHQPDLDYILKSSLQKTEEEIEKIRKEFIREIRKRKCTSIQNHLKTLNEEEGKLLSEFDSAVSNHLQSYPLSKPVGYIEKKPKFEVFANKDYIFQSVENITSDDVTIPQMSFTFSENFLNKVRPLGVVEMSNTSVKLSKDIVTVCKLISDDDKLTQRSVSAIADDLKLIHEELNTNVINATDVSEINDAIPKSFEANDDEMLVNVLSTYINKGNDKSKMIYLCDLIAKNDIASFKLLWDSIPQKLLQLKCRSCNILQAACTFNKPEFVRVILDAGANVNETVDGGTALLLATGYRNLSIVELLIEHDANILKKIDGYNVVDYAKKANYPEIVDFLLLQLESHDMKDDGTLCNKTIEMLKEDNLVELYDLFSIQDILEESYDGLS